MLHYLDNHCSIGIGTTTVDSDILKAASLAMLSSSNSGVKQIHADKIRFFGNYGPRFSEIK